MRNPRIWQLWMGWMLGVGLCWIPQLVWAQTNLRFKSWSAPSTTVGAGSSVVVEYEIENVGNTNAGAFNLSFYYNTSASISQATSIKTVSVTGVDAGKSGGLQKETLVLPNNVIFGTGYLVAFIDSGSKVAESNESDNYSYHPLTLTGLPDLRVTFVGVSPSSQVPGGSLTLTYRLYNAGSTRVTTTFYTRFYLSTDQTINSGDIVLSQTVYTAGLLAYTYDPASANGTITVTIPTTATAAKSYIIAHVDWDDRVKNESSNSNNTYVAAVDIVTQKPDLSIKTFSLNPTSSAGYGQKVKVTYNVQNIGTGEAAGTYYLAMYYADSNASSATLTYITRVTLPKIAAKSDTGNQTVDIDLPRNVVYGTRYIHYFIDYTNQIDEIREDNNRGAVSLTINRYPNLRIYALSVAPTSQVAGGEIRLSYTAYNEGSSKAGASTIYCYYSVDKVLGSGDLRMAGQIDIPALDAQTTSSGVTSFTLPTAGVTDGTRYVVCRIDALSRVGETSETDNDKEFAITIIRAIADLQMDTWQVPTSSPGYNDKVSIPYRVKNQGNADAGESTLAFYYTDSATFATTIPLGTVKIKALKAGETASDTFVATLPNNVLTGTRYIHYFIDSENKVSESIETNNQGSQSFNITGQANFQVTVLSLNPTSQIPGGQVAVTYRIKNTGLSRFTQNTYFRFYFSTDTTIDASDTVLGTLYSPPLNAGDSWPSTGDGTLTVVVPSSATTGTFYIGVWADYSDLEKESDEKDNTKTAPIQITTGIADLQMDTWSISPTTTAGAGDPITVKFKIKNTGKVDAGAFKVVFTYSDSTGLSNASDLATVNVTGVVAGQSTTELTATLTLPNQVAVGKRYIHYAIDSANTIPESSESNNKGYTEINIDGKANLEVSVLSITPTSQMANGYVTITYHIKNTGKVRSQSGTYVGFYYSTDATIDLQDTLLSSAYIGIINAGDSYPTTGPATITVRVPATVTTGSTVYIGAYADYTKLETESNETDNSKGAPLQIVAAVAELSMYSWSFTPTSASGAGSTIDIDFRVRNTGTLAASGFKVTFYYSPNNDLNSTQGLIPLGEVTIRRVDPNTIDSTQTLSGAKIPPEVLAGKGYIHYIIDPDQQVPEYYETNNRGANEITITGLPNLQISVLSVQPTTQGGGGSLAVTLRVYNAGLVAVSNVKLGLYLSQDTTIDTQDTQLYTSTLALIKAQGFYPDTQTTTINVTLPLTAQAGTAYIGAYIDYDEQVKELTETDNTQTAAIQITAPKPDLQVTAASVSPSTQKTGQSVTVNFSIRNGGGLDVTSYQVGIYFSPDATIDGNDTLIKNVTMTALKSGDTVTHTETITLPQSLPSGKGYLGIFVDNDSKITENDENNNTGSAELTVLTDQDQDGVYSDTDCNDNDKTIYPNAPEICDGKDNDCNGKIDDNPNCICKVGETRDCYTGASGCTQQSDGSYTCTPSSPCKAGKQACVNGQWDKTCQGEVVAQAEQCNNIDDNCDGKIDENLSEKCYTGKTGTENQGVCKEGIRTCTNGQWSSCVGEVVPGQESCDGQDNDCDGQIDNQPGGNNPLEQPCTTSCGNGVESCQNGKWVNCTAPTTCEPGSESIAESSPETSGDAGTNDTGVSPDADCYTNGCPSGEVCKNAQCVSDPCRNANCQADEFCRDGSCIKACGCISCNQGEICVDGACSVDPCAGANCTGGKVCDKTSGQCVDDPCQGITCNQGRICSAGNCIHDPCHTIQCPQGMQCRDGQCVGANCSGQEGQTETTQEATQESTTENSGETVTDTQATESTSTTETVGENATETMSPESLDDSGTTESDPESTSQDKTGGTDTTTPTDLSTPPGGCGCHATSPIPLSILFFLFGTLLFLVRIRR